MAITVASFFLSWNVQDKNPRFATCEPEKNASNNSTVIVAIHPLRFNLENDDINFQWTLSFRLPNVPFSSEFSEPNFGAELSCFIIHIQIFDTRWVDPPLRLRRAPTFFYGAPFDNEQIPKFCWGIPGNAGEQEFFLYASYIYLGKW